MKRYSVRIAPELQSFLRHLSPNLKIKIRRALEELEQDPWLGKALKGKLLGLFSYRVSQYRIVYQIQHHDLLIQVIEIAARKIVYQKVSDLLTS